jgi:hypothetical protein|tara:strand:+ start:2953 stop:3285 length:333 start_codon:yes stop_codon:yes gene_type:complete
MTLKPIKITYNGKEDTVEYEDSLTFGDVEELVGQSVDLSDVTKPKIDLQSYRMNLLVKVLKKAPFKTGDVTTLKLLDSKVVQKILREVLRTHPLADYIEDWMRTFQNFED